jgi:glycine/D-amino acid oxidase-like deaminating enzyme
VRLVPFWTEDHPRPTDLGKGALPAETDVLVVGSGYTGLSAARELAILGRDVTVVDRGEIASGASSINGGQVNYGPKGSAKKLFAQHGPETGRRIWDASMAAIETVEEIVGDEDIACDFSRPGAVELAYRASEYDDLVAESRWMARNLDFETEPIPPDRIGEVIDSGHFACALVDFSGGSLHPAKYAFGLADAAAGRGATLVGNAEVTAIERSGAGFRVTTSVGAVGAGAVIMATNGYTPPRLVPGLRRAIVPVGSYQIATEPLGEATAERLLPKRRNAWTARRLLNYFRRSPDDRILFGGRHTLSTGRELMHSAIDLRASMLEIFPELEDAEITHSWSGTVGVTFDLLPHIGTIDGIWYAMGYSGHGVGLSTYLGREVGRIVAGAPAGCVFAEIEPETRFFYRNQPWFLPFAARLYDTLDYFGR